MSKRLESFLVTWKIQIPGPFMTHRMRITMNLQYKKARCSKKEGKAIKE